MNTVRNYSDEIKQIIETYKSMYENQTLDWVKQQHQHYDNFPNINSNIWDIIHKLDNIIDESDPDTDISQIHHAFQTAESIRIRFLNDDNTLKRVPIKMLFRIREWNSLEPSIKYLYNKSLDQLYPTIQDWSWLPLIGLIHDLGKVMVLKEFGELPQWSVVGDTFPVGCPISPQVVYYDKKFHEHNPDFNVPNYQQDFGIYNEKIGFNEMFMSWGHDEYMAKVLEKNCDKHCLPSEAIYVIRFHSFYPWHTPKKGSKRGYTQYANIYDWKMLPLLKMLQLSDLYSKDDAILNNNKLKEKYQKTIEKYFSNQNLNW
tara:strand:- start:2056 stop:3000 length:945 start_codon:yes stop_codon:yes gene_type:complete